MMIIMRGSCWRGMLKMTMTKTTTMNNTDHNTYNGSNGNSNGNSNRGNVSHLYPTLNDEWLNIYGMDE